MYALKLPPAPRQVLGEDMQVLTDVLHDGVNLAVWQRRLPAQIADFAEALLAQGADAILKAVYGEAGHP